MVAVAVAAATVVAVAVAAAAAHCDLLTHSQLERGYCVCWCNVILLIHF